MNKFLIALFLGMCIAGGYFIYIHYAFSTISSVYTDAGAFISRITSSPVEYIDHETQVVNPSKYKTAGAFMSVLVTNTGSMPVDITKEDFYILHTNAQGQESIIKIDASLRGDIMTATGTRKDSIISDIFSVYQSGGIIPESSGSRSGIRMIPEHELMPVSQTHNRIISANTTDTGSFNALKKSLEISAKTDEDKKSLAYMYEYEGDYARAMALRSTLTDGNMPNVTTHIEGIVTEGRTNAPLSGVTVELLNNKDIKTTTDSTGKYTFDIPLADSSRYRLRAWDPTHSDGFAAFSTYASGTTQSVYLDFTIHTPDKIVDISLARDTHDGVFTVTSSQSTYTIPVDGLYTTDGTIFRGDQIRAYLYEFTKHTNMANYMYNDTFDAVYGYVGNIMKTFGMPYMQIYDTEGNELHIRKTHPALLRNKIYHMKELYDNYDHIYTAITGEDMNYIVAASKTDPTGFPITRAWLISNHMLKWPAWWCLNRTKGVWEAVGQRVVDPSGIIETQYYTID